MADYRGKNSNNKRRQSTQSGSRFQQSVDNPRLEGRGGKLQNAFERKLNGSQSKAKAKGKDARYARKKPAKSSGSESSLIEGRRAVAEALDLGLNLKSAMVVRSVESLSDPSLRELVARLEDAGVPVEEVPRAQLDTLSSHGAHQGIMARTKPFEYASVEDILHTATGNNELVLLLDHVTDEGNFGAIVRSAEVVGAKGVIIANARAAKVGTGAYKTSAGAVLHVPIAQVANLASAAQKLKDAGFWIVGATEHAEQSVWEAPMSGKLCIVMGSEGSGISRLMRDTCDFECKLPQRGRVESLNVAQAATVMAYEWLRRTTEEGA